MVSVDCMLVLRVSGLREIGDAPAVPNVEMDETVSAAEAAAPDIRTSRRVTGASVGLLMCASSDEVKNCGPGFELRGRVQPIDLYQRML